MVLVRDLGVFSLTNYKCPSCQSEDVLMAGLGKIVCCDCDHLAPENEFLSSETRQHTPWCDYQCSSQDGEIPRKPCNCRETVQELERLKAPHQRTDDELLQIIRNYLIDDDYPTFLGLLQYAREHGLLREKYEERSDE